MPVRTGFATDWQSLPPALAPWLGLPAAASGIFPPSPLFLRTPAIPLYLRDCAYVI